MFSTDYGVKRYFYVQHICFTAMGIKLTVATTKKGHIPWIAWMSSLALMTVMLAWAAYAWQHFTEINEVCDAMAPFLQSFLALWKIFSFVSKREAMAILIERITTISMEASEAERTIIANENTRDALPNILYYIAATLTASIGIIASIFVSVFLYLKNGELKLVWLLKGVYLLDYTQPLHYFIIFIWTTLAFYGVVNGSVAVDSLYSWYVHNIVAQFRILHMKLEQFNANAECVDESSLLEWFDFHQRVISLADSLNVNYRLIIFVEFFLNSAQICFLAYQIGSGISSGNLPFVFVFLVAVAMQLMIYAQCAQRLQNESEQLAQTLFSTLQWHNLSSKLRKLVLFSMMRAQKPCKLSGIFFDVGLPQFLWVFRTAGSFMALLRSIDKPVSGQTIM